MSESPLFHDTYAYVCTLYVQRQHACIIYQSNIRICKRFFKNFSEKVMKSVDIFQNKIINFEFV